MAEIILTTDNFTQEVLESKLPVIVDFYATWCAPCRMISPIIAEIAREKAGQIKVGVVNIDEQPDLAEAYRVISIPSIKVFNGGKVVNSWTGYLTKEQLLRML